MRKHRLALVDVSALPEIFSGVLSAKQMLASGDAKSASEAAKKCGISRSAFYKYRNSVFLYNEQNVINLRAQLLDEAGVLSEFIAVFYRFGANILTVNQGIPSNNVAEVTVSARTDPSLVDEMIDEIAKKSGVVLVEKII